MSATPLKTTWPRPGSRATLDLARVAAVPSDKRARQKQARAERLEREKKVAKRRQITRRGVLIGIVGVVVIASVWFFTARNSNSTSATSSTTSTTSAASNADTTEQAAADKVATAAGCPTNPTTRVNTLTWSAAPAMSIDTSKSYTALIKTDVGDITVKLNAASTSQTVNNFVFLAQKGYYHCVTFHRVIPNFMDQTGDPTGSGSGGPGYTIPDEFPATASPQYPIGSVAMANTGATNSGGSQFFIVTGAEGEALPAKYTLFGSVTAGMDVAQTIATQGGTQANNGVPPKVTHRILSITIQTN